MGSPYEDSYDKAERENTLTPKEVAILKAFDERRAKAEAEFSGKLRELEAAPETVTKYSFTIRMDMTGEFLKRFLWLDHHLVQTGIFTRGELMQAIITLGTNHLVESEQSKAVAGMMRMQVLSQMPPEVQYPAALKSAKAMLKVLAETEAQAFKESMESQPPEETAGGAKTE